MTETEKRERQAHLRGDMRVPSWCRFIGGPYDGMLVPVDDWQSWFMVGRYIPEEQRSLFGVYERIGERTFKCYQIDEKPTYHPPRHRSER
jgi:hypothetical protein